MTPSDRSILWELCFGDAPDVAESFLGISDVITVEERSGGVLIGMASLVPVHTESVLSGYYAYGVCTHPDHRGKGVFTRLMASCEREAQKKAVDFICLIPATERLASTYARMRYFKKVALYDAAEKSGAAILSASHGFSDFATPDTDDAPLLTVNFGVMKPLTRRAEQQSFYFATPMGER